MKPDFLERFGLQDRTALTVIKHAQFRDHLHQALSEAEWQRVEHNPIALLQNLYPTVYHYGPHALTVPRLVDRFIERYSQDSISVITALPEYDGAPVEPVEFDYLDLLLRTQFRPVYEQRGLWQSVTNDLNLHVSGGADSTATRYQVHGMLAMALARDLIPATPTWRTLTTAHDRFVRGLMHESNTTTLRTPL